jgi:deoxyadenosine/deoxycytidine kinase
MKSDVRGRDVYVTGNIAAGKSTLAKLLAEHIKDAAYVPERYEHNPFLPLYLEHQERWAFANLVHYYLDYVQVLQEHVPRGEHSYHFIDAGSYTNRLLYARYAQADGILTPEEHQFYMTLCEVIDRAYDSREPYAFIFVEASPETCWGRMRRRGWDLQRPVDIGYIKRLSVYLEEMKRVLIAQHFPVLEIDSEEFDFTREPERTVVLDYVHEFLEEVNSTAGEDQVDAF